MMKRPSLRQTIAAALLLAIVPAAAVAGSKSHKSHEQVRDALRRGEVLPLTRIMAIAQARAPGQVIKVELDDDDDHPRRLIYEVKTLSSTGRVMEVEIDARTGKVLKVEED
ncbi:PepSY domain-containing protein [Sphingomonas flavalba]|uniref:PepSY domain-containing protein n=1 Tax=Sphingomonas flavalba TaxID=2559804 RepID=UPI0019D13205|nr:PepSY domain-containing protein [Sphingomonas flavalba]